VLTLVLFLTLTKSQIFAQEKPFDLHGVYLEGCRCKVARVCDLRGSMERAFKTGVLWYNDFLIRVTKKHYYAQLFNHNEKFK